MKDREAKINNLVRKLSPMVRDDLWVIETGNMTKEELVKRLGETVADAVLDRRFPLSTVLQFAELGVLLYQEKNRR